MKEKRQKAREKVARMWMGYLALDEADFDRVIRLISNYSHLEACRPFVVVDLQNGVARSVILDRYCLRDHELRRIGIDAGVYKPKRF
ncbi:MAG TPA: hypothetical protein PLI53_08650 [Geobacteraceae bacterium]|nr:hypothetical protein [Geobacteraceae bacterium]